MLAGFDGRHNGMLRRMEMLGRVPILRIVAATDVSRNRDYVDGWFAQSLNDDTV
jgi:hypothetical protein